MLRYRLASGVVIATVFLAVYTPLQAADQSGVITPFQAETIKPHHAETIKPGWVKNNMVSKGKLEQVLPRNFADPKQRYWKLHHGKDVYYIASESSGELTFYSPGTNLYAAGGKRQKKATGGK